jgi:hypothetical protein
MAAPRRLLAALPLALLAATALAPAHGQSIYTCTDAKGRRLTSDRPIMECLDREQKQYGTGGTVRNTLPPSMTAEERAAADEKAKRAQEEQLRQAEARRRDRVLVNRYHDVASHDRERADALGRIDDIIGSSERRLQDLQRQREELQADLAKAAKDANRSARVTRSLDENADNQAAQRRSLAAQRDERQRVSSRFDEELARLRELWAQQAAAPAAKAAASRPKS